MSNWPSALSASARDIVSQAAVEFWGLQMLLVAPRRILFATRFKSEEGGLLPTKRVRCGGEDGFGRLLPCATGHPPAVSGCRADSRVLRRAGQAWVPYQSRIAWLPQYSSRERHSPTSPADPSPGSDGDLRYRIPV